MARPGRGATNSLPADLAVSARDTGGALWQEVAVRNS